MPARGSTERDDQADQCARRRARGKEQIYTRRRAGETRRHLAGSHDREHEQQCADQLDAGTSKDRSLSVPFEEAAVPTRGVLSIYSTAVIYVMS